MGRYPNTPLVKNSDPIQELISRLHRKAQEAKDRKESLKTQEDIANCQSLLIQAQRVFQALEMVSEIALSYENSSAPPRDSTKSFGKGFNSGYQHGIKQLKMLMYRKLLKLDMIDESLLKLETEKELHDRYPLIDSNPCN